ncbi:hypothetical protein [Roseospira goensis]|uniref:Uncharacterized protein n=1 Tax=Roseospira goensis TaxID=391922 RepID=A0A7W6S0M7_9PROT|nr:hypothetical protein [Roseospira goensis]MBB4286089.1 hypothetical protein [Roseospira goensis]
MTTVEIMPTYADRTTLADSPVRARALACLMEAGRGGDAAAAAE